MYLRASYLAYLDDMAEDRASGAYWRIIPYDFSAARMQELCLRISHAEREVWEHTAFPKLPFPDWQTAHRLQEERAANLERLETINSPVMRSRGKANSRKAAEDRSARLRRFQIAVRACVRLQRGAQT